MYLFEGLKESASGYLEPEQVELLKQAYQVARDAHEGQMRTSGEPYITHPVAVAPAAMRTFPFTVTLLRTKKSRELPTDTSSALKVSLRVRLTWVPAVRLIRDEG